MLNLFLRIFFEILIDYENESIYFQKVNNIYVSKGLSIKGIRINICLVNNFFKK